MVSFFWKRGGPVILLLFLQNQLTVGKLILHHVERPEVTTTMF